MSMDACICKKTHAVVNIYTEMRVEGCKVHTSVCVTQL